VDGACAIGDLLQQLNLPGGAVVVELNGSIVKRGSYGTTMVRDGDAVEIVRLVGGG